MSVIFNNTFTSDKPIYYPSNWQSGKTGEQLYLQFKSTTSFWLFRNSIEIIAASLWVFLFYVIVLGGTQIIRLYKLDRSDRERIDNRKYVEGPFLRGVALLILMVLSGSGIVLYQDWGPIVLVKGLITFPIVFGFRRKIGDVVGKGFQFVVGVVNGKGRKRDRKIKVDTEQQTEKQKIGDQ